MTSDKAVLKAVNGSGPLQSALLLQLFYAPLTSPLRSPARLVAPLQPEAPLSSLAEWREEASESPSPRAGCPAHPAPGSRICPEGQEFRVASAAPARRAVVSGVGVPEGHRGVHAAALLQGRPQAPAQGAGAQAAIERAGRRERRTPRRLLPEGTEAGLHGAAVVREAGAGGAGDLLDQRAAALGRAGPAALSPGEAAAAPLAEA
eukprot:scaffold268_cov236-Pinguiococcus_pyrenoidosus.AAC.7